MQVSVPGIYQKPAPYSEQTLTYSIALALIGRSAAWAPVTAARLAAEQRRTRVRTAFIVGLHTKTGGTMTSVCKCEDDKENDRARFARGVIDAPQRWHNILFFRRNLLPGNSVDFGPEQASRRFALDLVTASAWQLVVKDVVVKDLPRQKLRWARICSSTVFWSLNSYVAVGFGAAGVSSAVPVKFWSSRTYCTSTVKVRPLTGVQRVLKPI